MLNVERYVLAYPGSEFNRFQLLMVIQTKLVRGKKTVFFVFSPLNLIAQVTEL